MTVRENGRLDIGVLTDIEALAKRDPLVFKSAEAWLREPRRREEGLLVEVVLRGVTPMLMHKFDPRMLGGCWTCS